MDHVDLLCCFFSRNFRWKKTLAEPLRIWTWAATWSNTSVLSWPTEVVGKRGGEETGIHFKGWILRGVTAFVGPQIVECSATKSWMSNVRLVNIFKLNLDMWNFCSLNTCQELGSWSSSDFWYVRYNYLPSSQPPRIPLPVTQESLSPKKSEGPHLCADRIRPPIFSSKHQVGVGVSS